MKKRIDLRLWHQNCWMLALTRRYPGVELVVDDICSDGTDILATVVVSAAETTADLETIADAVAEYPAVRSADTLVSRADHLRIHTRYDATKSIYGTVVESSLTPIGEVRIADDSEHWTLIADGTAISAAIASLEERAMVDVRRVHDYEPAMSTAHDLVDDVRGEISERQLTYLLSALEEEYYNWPRGVSAKDLANQHGVSGPTALEHLRKGEAAILRSVLEEIAERERRETAVQNDP